LAGHVERLSGEDILNRTMDCQPEGRRRTGIPKFRLISIVIKKLGVKNWWTVARDRKAWRSFGKPRPTLGCRATDDDDDVKNGNPILHVVCCFSLFQKQCGDLTQ
jgi:hypothetical protein